MKSIGEQLKAARLKKNLTPEALAKVTRIQLNRLLDLENDDFSRFPSPAHARGFVRIYARNVGMDERKVLAQLDGEQENDENGMYVPAPSVEYVPEPVRVTAPVQASDLGHKVIVAIAFVFCIGFVAAMWKLVALIRVGIIAPKAIAVVQSNPDNNIPTAVPVATAAAVPALPSDGSIPKATPVNEAPATPTAPAVIVQPTPPVAVAVNPAAPPPATPSDDDNKPVMAALPVVHKLTLNAKDQDVVVRLSVPGKEATSEFTLKKGQKREFDGQHFTVEAKPASSLTWQWDGDDMGKVSDNDDKATVDLPGDN